MIPYKKNPKVIHETIVRDLVEIISDGIKRNDDYDDLVVWGKGARHSFKSISKASANLTLTFPVLISDSADLETSIMISKSHERKCAAMMHMLFSALCVSGDKENVYDYLKQFHTNLNFDADDLNVDNFNDAMDTIADNIDESYINDKRFKDWAYNLICEDAANLNYYMDDDLISEHSINDYKVIHMKGKYGECQILTPIKEGQQALFGMDHYTIRTPNGDTVVDTKALTRDLEDPNTRDMVDLASLKTYLDTTNRTGIGLKNSKEQNKTLQNINNQLKLQNMNLKNQPKGTISRDDPHWSKVYADKMSGMEKAHSMRANPFVKTDVPKANELLPTMMVVHFHTYASPEPVTAVIGIKAKLYPISSQEIINRLVVRNKDNQGFHNFLRAATREISFFKDFVFAVDKAKIDALSSSKRGSDSKIWKLLERRAIKSKIRRSFGMSNDATAITSVAITQEEVEILKKEYDLDITKAPILKPIMEAYNLMGFMIIDNNVESVKFWYDDGSNKFETLSFRSLERESGDQNYKKVINLMTKMVR